MTTTRTVGRRVLGAAGILAILATAFVGGLNAWVRAESTEFSPQQIASMPSRDIIIVPGSPTSRGAVKATLLGRLEGALALFRTSRAPKILVSGIDTPRDPQVSAMTSWLVAHGVPQDRILVDAGGVRTRATMDRAARLFGVREAIVCSETLSMPRALFLAHDFGIDAVGFSLPTTLTRSPKIVAVELLKTTLAFVESTLADPNETDRGDHLSSL